MALCFLFSLHAFADATHPAPDESGYQLSLDYNSVQSLLARAKPGQEFITAGCYNFRVADLAAIKPGSAFVTGKLWTDGIVYYSFNPDNMTDVKKNAFRAAAAEWENVAALAFIEVPFGNEGVANYIEVRDHPSANNSNVGMINGKQILNMFNWSYKFIIAHEIGHALGQWHEQNRLDQDTYVTINYDNIDPAYDDFNWQPLVGNYNGTTYDFDSCLHYGPTSGAKSPGLVIIAPKPGFEAAAANMGQREKLSDTDKVGMAARYGALIPAGQPTLSFDSGTYNVASLTILLGPAPDHNNSLSIYRYTMDNSDPTANSLQWPVNTSKLLQNSTTVKVRHFRGGKSPSAVLTRVYTLTQATPIVATPQISPAGGAYNDIFNCSITVATAGAQIRYTTNGATPTESSPLYSGPFQVTQSLTVKARAYKTGSTPSDIASAVYSITPLQIPAPSIYPPTGTYNGPQTLNISTTVANAQLRYTTNGAEPTINSFPVDENPPIITSTATVKAKAFLTGYTPSNTTTVNLTIIGAANTPTITPNGGTHTAPRSVTLSTTTAGATIRYTLNGSEPQSYSTLYSGAFNLPLGTTTVKTKAFLTGANPSGTASATFNVFSADAAQVNSPTYLPVGRDHVTQVQVTLSCNTQGAQIRYTVGDNVQPSDPTAASTLYTGPFTLGLTPGAGDFWFVKARAFKTGLTDSNVVGKTYGVYEPLGTIAAPGIAPDGGTFNNAVTVTFSSSTNPATDPSFIQFYRTIDGSDPFVPDPASGGANSFSLAQPATVKALAYRQFFGTSTITASQPFIFICADPTITPEENGHIESVQFSIATATTGATRRYTLDGSEPEAAGGNGLTYTTPVTLGIGTHIVKAKVFRANFDPSETITQVYVVEPQPIAPQITDQPDNLTVDQGQEAAFDIAATGVPDPEYQWQFNNVSLTGETTTTLRLINVQPVNAGEYRCIVSNKAGATTSTAALLTVNPVITPTPTETPEATPTPSPTATETITPTPTATPPADCVRFEIPIEASQVPADTLAHGSAIIQVDTAANTLTYHIQFFNLSSPEIFSHIHGFAGRGADAGVLYNLPSGTPKIGVINYQESEEANILAGLTYINIHSQNFPSGEIRGQIDGPIGLCLTPTPTPEPTTEPLDGWLLSNKDSLEPQIPDIRLLSMAPPRPAPLPAP